MDSGLAASRRPGMTGKLSMSSNIKPKTPSKESPTEPFKRAVASCMRAIARKPDLEISYAAERPGMAGGKARLPEPPRKLNVQYAAIVRGHSDSIALKLACHDPAVHRRQMPGGQQARAVFEAVEQARVEAIGARRMQGVAQNLSAMLDDRFHRGKFDDITDRADAPIEDAVAMIVRERLTGQQPPPAARKLVDLWRPFIEERAGRELDRLEKLGKRATRKPPTGRGGRASTDRTSRAGPSITPMSRSSTRRSRPRICASRRSSTGCAAISTSSSRICRAWCRGSPIGCSAA